MRHEPTADRQFDVADPQRHAALTVQDALGVVQVGDVRPVDPDETVIAPLLLQICQRRPQQVGSLLGVQPRIVALGLGPADRGDRQQQRRIALKHRDPDHLRLRGGLGCAGLRHPPQSLVQPLGPHWFEQVVPDPQFEGFHSGLCIRSHENDLRRALRHGLRLTIPREVPRQIQAAVTWHMDIQQDDVDPLGIQHMPGLSHVGGRVHRADQRLLVEQPLHLLDRRRLIIDDERPQLGILSAHLLSAHLLSAHNASWRVVWAGNFGTRMETRIPASVAVSMVRPFAPP